MADVPPAVIAFRAAAAALTDADAPMIPMPPSIALSLPPLEENPSTALVAPAMACTAARAGEGRVGLGLPAA